MLPMATWWGWRTGTGGYPEWHHATRRDRVRLRAHFSGSAIERAMSRQAAPACSLESTETMEPAGRPARFSQASQGPLPFFPLSSTRIRVRISKYLHSGGASGS